MHYRTRSLVWQGRAFHEGVTTEEFDVRSLEWLRVLFGRQGAPMEVLQFYPPFFVLLPLLVGRCP